MIATDQENLLGIYNLESKKNSNHLPTAQLCTPVFIPNKLSGFSFAARGTPKHPKKGRGLQLMCSAINKVTIKNKACCASFCRKPKGMEEHEQVPQLAMNIALGFFVAGGNCARLRLANCCIFFQQTKDFYHCNDSTIGDSKSTEDGSKDSTWLRGLNNRLILSYNPTCTASQNHQAVGVICTLGNTIAQKIRKSQTSSPSNKNSHDIEYFHSQLKTQGTEKKTESIFVPVCMHDISLFLSDLSLTQSAWDLGFTDSPPVSTDPPCTHPRNHKILDRVCFLHLVLIMLPVMCMQFVLLSAGADDVTC